jgi:DNA transposition AAA+ family ATPase
MEEGLPIIIEHTISALQKYQNEKGSSQAAIGRACNLSGAVISQFVRGEYKGDVESVCKKIQDFLAWEEEREKTFISPFFVRTKQAEDVLTVCAMSHRYKFLGLVQARAGLGKTTALREYVSNNSGAAMITASTFNCTRGALASMIGKAIRISSTYSTLGDAAELIIHKLGAGALLIVDEAQHLPRETLDGLRFIHDMSGVGIVLSGTIQISSRLADKRIGINFEQVASRIGCRRTLSEKVRWEDVKKVVHQAIPGGNGEILDYCFQKANAPGAYRTMMRYIQVATANAEAKKEAIDVKHFREAEGVLMV